MKLSRSWSNVCKYWQGSHVQERNLTLYSSPVELEEAKEVKGKSYGPEFVMIDFDKTLWARWWRAAVIADFVGLSPISLLDLWIFGLFFNSLNKSLLFHLLCLAGGPELSLVLIIPNLFYLRIMEAAQIPFLQSWLDLCHLVRHVL